MGFFLRYLQQGHDDHVADFFFCYYKIIVTHYEDGLEKEQVDAGC